MSNRETPFGPKNYIFLAIFTGVIVLGFGIMALESGAGFIDAKEFSWSLHICPILIIGGFAGVIYAIVQKPNLPLEPEPVVKRRSTSSRRGSSPSKSESTDSASSKSTSGSSSSRRSSNPKGGSSKNKKKSSRR